MGAMLSDGIFVSWVFQIGHHIFTFHQVAKRAWEPGHKCDLLVSHLASSNILGRRVEGPV